MVLLLVSPCVVQIRLAEVLKLLVVVKNAES